MSTQDSDLHRELALWFRDRLNEGNIHFDAEPLSYEANTDYDLAFYRLQAEARRDWLNRYGYAPTPGQLTRAFFDAEFERFQTARSSRRARLARFLGRWLGAPFRT
jgi:hypothetical protein